MLFLMALAGLEAGVRLLGLADVPIRRTDRITGYIPLPSQHGRFLLNDWTINSLSMISSREYVDAGNEIILAGDSIVFGGNPLAQNERVGEQLDKLLPQPVYSIADGSWGLKNELGYFLNSDKITKPDVVVFVLNSADFSKPSTWQCFSFHPTSRPLVHTYFAYRKYFIPDCEEYTPEFALVADFDANIALNELVGRYSGTTFKVFLYQNRQELAEQQSLLELMHGFDRVIDGTIQVKELLDYSEQVQWTDNHYDGDMHPTPEGAAVLAKALRLFLTESE